MSAAIRSLVAANAEAQIAAAYNQAGGRYARYADGGGRQLFSFEGRYAYSDRKTWQIIETKLLRLRARGAHRLRVLDLGCGPGTWLRRVVVRAKQLGFGEIIAQGTDIADTQLHQARLLSRGLGDLGGVELSFSYGDLRDKITGPQNDLCLCLYGVLNHMPVAELPVVLDRIAALCEGYFIATVRTTGSMPTVYVDHVSSALRFYQDNSLDRLDVEFANGQRTSFHSHLFSRGELSRLAGPRFEVEEIRGLDLFHGRFANDPRWNPSGAVPPPRLSQELARLEERYCTETDFADYASHLMLVAHNRKMTRP